MTQQSHSLVFTLSIHGRFTPNDQECTKTFWCFHSVESGWAVKGNKLICVQQYGWNLKHTVWFHICEIIEKIKITVTESIYRHQRPVVRGEDWLQMITIGHFELMEMFRVMISVVISQVNRCKISLNCTQKNWWNLLHVKYSSLELILNLNIEITVFE